MDWSVTRNNFAVMGKNHSSKKSWQERPFGGKPETFHRSAPPIGLVEPGRFGLKILWLFLFRLGCSIPGWNGDKNKRLTGWVIESFTPIVDQGQTVENVILLFPQKLSIFCWITPKKLVYKPKQMILAPVGITFSSVLLASEVVIWLLALRYSAS